MSNTSYGSGYGDGLDSLNGPYGGSLDYSLTMSNTLAATSETATPSQAGSDYVHTGTPIDWNGLFQRMLESPDETQEQRLKKYEDISTLNNNFVSMAKQLGKIIIAEAFIPDNMKTIKPYHLGGVAGGRKYLYNGILFKLQTNWKNLYGSDHNAMKSGSLELKGLMRYYGFNKVHVPLMAIIDYRGFRLLAESKLPISAETLHYGSADAGLHVKDGSSCPELRELMQTVGTTLNLSGHWCGLSEDKQTFLYGPIDVEGHKGTDGRFYVIDLARVFPPTAEADVQRTFLYQAFRPEFVRHHKQPLSSDAFSKFSKGCDDAEEQNQRVKNATQHLLEVTVPDFAQWLLLNPQAIRTDHPLSDITELAHREGINVRYLGLLRRDLQNLPSSVPLTSSSTQIRMEDLSQHQQQLRSYVLMELIARVIKNKLNFDLRSAVQTRPSRGDENYLPIALKFFNIILGNKSASEDWWRSKIKELLVASYKVECLSPEERMASFSLRPLVNLHTLFRRVLQLTGVRFTKIVMEQLKTSKSFELVAPDIRKMGGRVKHMNITSQAQGSALAIQAMGSMSARIELNQTIRSLRGASLVTSRPGSDDHSDRISGYDRLFNLSMMKYEQAIRATPDNKSMLTHYASVLIRVGLLKTNLNEPSATYFDMALQKLRICGNTTALLQLGELLQYLKGYWFEADEIHRVAGQCFGAVTEADPTLAVAWSSWADTLVAQARSNRSSQAYALAGAKYRQALKLAPLQGVEWLANCHHCLSDVEVAAAVELVGRKKKRRCDSIFPILESTPTGDPIQANDKENAEYRTLVEAVSHSMDPLGAGDDLSSVVVGDGVAGGVVGVVSGSDLTASSSLIMASPSPSLGVRSSAEGISQVSSPSVLFPLAGEPGVAGSASVASSHPTSSKFLDVALVYNRSYITPGLLEPIITSFTGLKALKLAHIQSLPQNLPQIAPSLTELNIAGSSDANDRWLACIVSIPTLAKLDISNCPKLTHVALKDVMTKCHVLTHFYASFFGACQELKLEPHVGFVSHSLQTLHVAGFRTSAESWCRLIACSTLSSLRKLVLDECLEVNDTVLAALGQNCPLTHISLRSCTNISNQGIESLVSQHLRRDKSMSSSAERQASTPSTPETRNSANFKPLRYIDLSGCIGITSHTLDVLATHLSLLESVLFNGVNIFGASSSWLGVPQTASLSGSGSESVIIDLRTSTEKNRTTQAFHKLVENNPHLCRVELSHTGVCDTQLAQIASVSSAITQLKIVSEAVTDLGLHSLSKSGLTLQLLDLERASISDAGITELVKACGQSLTALSLSGCSNPGLTEAALIQVGLNCPQLTHLDLAHSSVASDKSVAFIAERCPKLQRLSLVGCRFITDLTIEALARHAHKLHYLNLSRCPCIISLGPLGDGCPELRELHVRGCEFVSDDTPGFGRLANLRALRYLDLQGCHYITDITLGMLETDACPDLQVLILGRNKLRDSHVQSLRLARRSLNVQNQTDQTLSSSVIPRSTSLNNSGSVLSESTELSTSNHSVGASSRQGQGTTHLRGSLSVAGNANPTSVATRTLLNDLKSIQKNPVPYVSAEPVDPSNLFIWHGNLLGPENTPYAGAIFHIELVFPPDYPTNPPSATLFTPLPHPHVHKDHICLDILSDYKGYFSAVQELERKDTKDLSGWHPSYTVQSILLSMQSFLMDMKENAHGTELRELMVKIPDSIRQAANFCCSKCQHRPGQPFPPIAAEVAMSSLSEKEIIAEELRCVHTRAPFTEDVLGICVEVTQRRQTGTIMNLSYQMQLLAHKAFLTGVRTGPSSSAANMVFIPLWIDDEHGTRAMPIAEASIAQLSTGNPGAIFHPNMALDVLTQLMKAMVVDLVRYSASINALQYYFASHRLLIAFTRKYPELLGVANRIVSKFAESPHYRSKRECPDLGCLLMLLTISDLSWRDIAQAYMQESFVRNAPRAMEKAPELATPHPDERVDNLRNEKTFLVTRVSLGIAMLQVYFLEHIGKPRGVKLEQVSANYDSLYGRLPVKVREEFLEAIKGISAIKTWAETFKFLGLPPRPNEEVTTWLRECVQLSIKAGYYKPGPRSGGDVCKYYQSGRCNRDDCPFYHPSSPSSLSRSNSKNGGSMNGSSSGGGGGDRPSLGRSGSAKFNNARDQMTSSSQPQSHSSSTPKRPRSRGSSTSSTASDVHAQDEFDLREFDGDHHVDSHGGGGASLSAPPSSLSLPGTRATSPIPPSHSGSLSARTAPTTPAWTGANPLLARSANAPRGERDPQHQPIPPAINILPPSTTTVVSRDQQQQHPQQPQQQHAPATTPPGGVTNAEENDDEGWVPAGRPRRKSKSSGSAPSTNAQPPPGSPGGRGLGRGQSNSHYHHTNRHRQEHGSHR